MIPVTCVVRISAFEIFVITAFCSSVCQHTKGRCALAYGAMWRSAQTTRLDA